MTVTDMAVTIINCYRNTVVVGFIETVCYRNARRLFQILEIETVRAPPLRATETTVT